MSTERAWPLPPLPQGLPRAQRAGQLPPPPVGAWSQPGPSSAATSRPPWPRWPDEPRRSPLRPVRRPSSGLRAEVSSVHRRPPWPPCRWCAAGTPAPAPAPWASAPAGTVERRPLAPPKPPPGLPRGTAPPASARLRPGRRRGAPPFVRRSPRRPRERAADGGPCSVAEPAGRAAVAFNLRLRRLIEKEVG